MNVSRDVAQTLLIVLLLFMLTKNWFDEMSVVHICCLDWVIMQQ